MNLRSGFESVIRRSLPILLGGFFAFQAEGQDLPLTIMDESASNWVVDCFAGNSTTGNVFYNGPKLEIGGLWCPQIPVTTPDGYSYMIDRNGIGLVEITPKGDASMLMGNSGFVEGSIENCVYGLPLWNLKNQSLYVTGPNCLRKIVKNSDGTESVEVVAGIPYAEGTVDGPAKSAKFPLRCLGVVCDSQGVFYWLQVTSKRPGGLLRRIKDDTVTTMPIVFYDTSEAFNWAMGEGNLSIGENDQVLYISDFFHMRVLRYDIPTGQLTRMCGVNDDSTDAYNRFASNADGPALTHASANSGMRCRYDSFYKNLWIYGPDESQFRWLRLEDGWVKTVFGTGSSTGWDYNGFNIPGSTFRIGWCSVTGVDGKGGVFVTGSGTPNTNVYRAYNKVLAHQ